MADHGGEPVPGDRPREDDPGSPIPPSEQPLGPLAAVLPAATAAVGAVGVVLVGAAPFAGWPPDWLPLVPGGTETVVGAVAVAAGTPTYAAVYGHDRVRVAKAVGVVTLELLWLVALIAVPFAIDPELLGLFPSVVVERWILPTLVVATALGVVATAVLAVVPVDPSEAW